jgi:hypothetical protein
MSVKLKFIGVRIEKTEFYSGKNYTVVSSPAPDEFSHPSRFRLQSQHPLGNVGTRLDVVVNVSGIVRTKNFTDKQTHQQKQFDEASVYFDVEHFAVHQNQPIQK